MKKILLLALTLAGQFVYAQNNGLTCETPYSLCNGLGVPFANSVNNEADHTSVGSFGCLLTMPNPSWFTMPIAQNGDFSFTIEQLNATGEPIDVNYLCWGPFEFSGAICGPDVLNSNTQVGCSFQTTHSEILSLPNAAAGNYYIIMTSNFSEQQGTITFNTYGNRTGPDVLNCDVANVKQVAGNNFILYPNPAKNSVNIAAEDAIIASVKIYDLTGKTIYIAKVNAASLTIDTSALATGTYLTEIKNSYNAKTIKKLIIN